MLGNTYDGNALPEGFTPIEGKREKRRYTPAEVCLLAIKRHNSKPRGDSLISEARLCESGGGASSGPLSAWDAVNKCWKSGAHITYRPHKHTC